MVADKLTPVERALRDRLRQLLSKHSQADIARETGVFPSHVSRYLNGTRIPASFCSDLCMAFGLNANWLLRGEGAMYVTDGASDTSEVASRIADVVRNMGVISKMKLGAIIGKKELKAHREMDEALRAHEKIQKQVEADANEVLETLMRRMFKTSLQDEAEAYSALLETAKQVARLTHNEDLRNKLLHLRGRYESICGDMEKSHELLRRALMRDLSLSVQLEPKSCLRAIDLTYSLYAAGKMKEAERIALAALALMGDSKELYIWMHVLKCLYGHFLVLRGEVQSGMTLLLTHYYQTEKNFRQSLYSFVVNAELLAGSRVIDDFIDATYERSAVSDEVLRHACLLESPTQLRRVCKKMIGHKKGQSSPESFIASYARILASAFGSGGKAALEQFESYVAEHSERSREYVADEGFHFVVSVYSTQVSRVGGDAERARQLLLKAEKLLEALPEREPQLVHIMATHYRNALLLIKDTTRSAKLVALRHRATTFFQSHIAKGYCSFQHLLEA